MTDPEQIAAAVAAALDRFGRVDVLVNNAGFGTVGALEEVEPDHLRGVMETMYFGPVALTRAVLPHMRERGCGAIVQISSMGGMVSFPGFGAYCSAKFALEAASEALHAEVGPLGITVLIVEPGSFRTEFGGARLHESPRARGLRRNRRADARVHHDVDGTQPGDPRKAAAAISPRSTSRTAAAAGPRRRRGRRAARRARGPARRARAVGGAQPGRGVRGLATPARRPGLSQRAGRRRRRCRGRA